MVANSIWGVTPRVSIEAECRRRGKASLVSGCLAQLGGEVEPELLRALAGPAGEKFLDGAEHSDTYWLRVWALRGIGWAWDPSAAPSVSACLRDPHWRVREMALKVVARHLLDETMSVARLRDDPVLRVRRAAERALDSLTKAGL